MIIGSLLIAGFAAVAHARLYFRNQALNIPPVEGYTVDGLLGSIGGSGLTIDSLAQLDFRKVTDVMEVMALPLEFFEQVITPEQVQQVLLNGAVKSLFNGEFFNSVKTTLKDKALMENKIKAFLSSLGQLTPLTAGDKTDVLVAKIPTQFYKYLSPVFALSATTFQATIRGFTQLFHLTKLTLRQLASVARTAIISAFKKLVDLPIDPGRVFSVLQILLNVVGTYAGLGPVASRVLEITKQLARLASQLSSKANLAIESIKSLDAKAIENVEISAPRINAPRSKTQRIYRKSESRAACPYLDQEGEIDYGKCPWFAGMPVNTDGNCPFKNKESLENCAWLKEHAGNCPWFLGEPIVRGEKTCPWLENGNFKGNANSLPEKSGRIKPKSSRKSHRRGTKRTVSKSASKKNNSWSSESIPESLSKSRDDKWSGRTKSKAVSSGKGWSRAAQSKSLENSNDGWSASGSFSEQVHRKSHKHSKRHSSHRDRWV